MSRRVAQPLRSLSDEERAELERVTRSRREAVRRWRRATALLAVAAGATFADAAKTAGLQVGDTVCALVRRFNAVGIAALDDRSRSGRRRRYRQAERERILREVQRTPDREQDGTATWSMSTLQRALRQADDGLPIVSTFTILHVLHEAGYTWQENRTWCHTGVAERKRKDGVVQVVDPAATEKRG